MSSLKLKINQPIKLINFLKRFSGIESTLLLEMDETSIKAKTHTPEKSVVKYSSMPLDEIFSEYSEIKDPIKIGIYNVDKFASSCKFFGESEFELIVEYNKSGDEHVGSNLILKNSSLEIEFICAQPKLFTYITDDLLTKITDTDNAFVEFELLKDEQSKLSSLFGIDSDYSKISFVKKGKGIYAKGKTFNLLLLEEDGLKDGKDCDLSVFKHHYVFLDREDSQVYIAEEKLILLSNESDTRMIIGEAE